MKTEIFQTAISRRNRVRFLYGFSEVILDPYYILVEKNGRKYIYGRPNNSGFVTKFSYDKIVNIKVLENARFSPIIPILKN